MVAETDGAESSGALSEGRISTDAEKDGAEGSEIVRLGRSSSEVENEGAAGSEMEKVGWREADTSKEGALRVMDGEAEMPSVKVLAAGVVMGRTDVTDGAGVAETDGMETDADIDGTDIDDTDTDDTDAAEADTELASGAPADLPACPPSLPFFPLAFCASQSNTAPSSASIDA